jgi:hypothetical protein
MQPVAKKIIYLICFGSIICSCKKYLDVDLASNIVIADQVFASDEKARSALLGLYANMINNGSQFSNWLVTAYSGLSSDELVRFNAGVNEQDFLFNEIKPTNAQLRNVWRTAYKSIYLSNAILLGVENSTSLSSDIRNSLIGEAKFVRAFCHFYIVNLFGDVPLITTTNYAITAKLPRTSSATIYEQIINDLKEAKSLLRAEYSDGSRTRPNKYTATALLARVYLYQGEWAKAESESTEVISSGIFTPLLTPSEVFSVSSTEIVWQLGQAASTPLELSNAFRPSGTSPRFYLRDTIMNSFESNDLRRLAWVDSIMVSTNKYYYPAKYKNIPNSQFYVVLRVSEQYLIRAEARANLNKTSEGIDDLNIIRYRAGLTELPSNLSLEDVISAVLKERKLEYFAEWGHRWFDLNRLNLSNSVLSTLKGPNWENTDVLWPIPVDELLTNPNLIQNPGY